MDCVVTSPPYWGLRDYGTGKWSGGDGKCDHQIPRNKGRVTPGDKQSTNTGSHPDTWKECGKCGATKEDLQLGLEKTPEEYVAKMVEVCRELKRVLKKDGTFWLNLGDTYSAARWSSGEGQPMNKNRDIHRAGKETEERKSGLPPKNLVGIPWRVALALQADGWVLRQDIIWSKPNPMPESVTDRCTKAHEYIFLLAKSQSYYFNAEAIKEKGVMYSSGSTQRDTRETHGLGGGNSGINEAKLRMGRELRENGFVMRNKRSVWTISTKPYKGAHFATFPPDLITPMVKAGCPEGGIVLDPFIGSGTTAYVARSLGRNYLGIDLNPDYIKLAEKRLAQQVLI